MLHLQARYLAVQLYFRHNEQMPAAVAAFAQWNAAHPEHEIIDVRNFIHRTVEKLGTHFTLLDRTGGGRPFKLPHDAAMRAVGIIAEGYMQEHCVIDGGVERYYYEHKRFTSLSEAIMHSAPLRALMQQYDVSHDYLLSRLHDVEPLLAYGPLPMKMVLTPLQMHERQQYCLRMLAALQADPYLLYKIFWVDECRILVSKDLFGRLKVWYDRRDLEGQPPEPHPEFTHGNARRIDLLLIVNAVLGCVYVEFLTGTTNIEMDGRINPAMQRQMALRMAAGAPVYKVGSWGKQVTLASIIKYVFGTLQLLSKPCNAGAVAIYVNSNGAVLITQHDKSGVRQGCGSQNGLAPCAVLHPRGVVQAQQPDTLLPCIHAALQIKLHLPPWLLLVGDDAVTLAICLNHSLADNVIKVNPAMPKWQADLKCSLLV